MEQKNLARLNELAPEVPRNEAEQCRTDRQEILARSPQIFRAAVERFPCLAIAREAAGSGYADCAVMNAANETAVAAFLRGGLPFMGIPALVRRTLDALTGLPGDSLEAVEAADGEARRYAQQCLSCIS